MSKVLYWVNIRFSLINGDFRFLMGTDLWDSVAILPNTNEGILMRKILLSSGSLGLLGLRYLHLPSRHGRETDQGT